MTLERTFHTIKENARSDWSNIRPSFERAVREGDVKSLAVKSSGVVLGSLLTAQGIYQLAKGATERVPNPEKPTELQTNYTRMFVGAMSAFFGASALYVAATAPIILKR